MELSGTQSSWNSVRPGFGLLKRETGFSIAASIAASLPGGRAKSGQNTAEEAGQPLLAVSRPSSVKSGNAADDGDGESESENSVDEKEDDKGRDDGDDDGENGDGVGEVEGEHDSRSIRSFESMLNGRREKKGVRARKSLSDRLAHMSGLTRLQSKEQQDASTKVCFFFRYRPSVPAEHRSSPIGILAPIPTLLPPPPTSHLQSRDTRILPRPITSSTEDSPTESAIPRMHRGRYQGVRS